MLDSGIVEDMRDVNPVEYIRAVGLRPEDSYGFLPLQVLSGSSFFFLYRDRPEYEQARAALPESEVVHNFDLFMGSSGPADNEISSDSWLGRRFTGLGDQAAELAKSYEGVYGAPAQPASVDLSGPNPVASDEQIASIEKLRAMGVLDDDAYREMISLAKGGEAGPLPGGAEAAAAVNEAPPIVVDRIHPGLHRRSSTNQLDRFMPPYRDALGLCPEDVYGVFPRGTFNPNRGPGQPEQSPVGRLLDRLPRSSRVRARARGLARRDGGPRPRWFQEWPPPAQPPSTATGSPWRRTCGRARSS